MDSTATEEITRQYEAETLPLFAVLTAVLGSVLIAVSFALWYKFCRTCRHQQREDEDRERDQDIQLETRPSGRRIGSFSDYLNEISAESSFSQTDDGQVRVDMSKRVAGRSSVYYQRPLSLEGPNFPPMLDYLSNPSIDEEVTSSASLDHQTDGKVEGDVAVEIHPRPSSSTGPLDLTTNNDGTGSSEDSSLHVTPSGTLRGPQRQDDIHYYGISPTEQLDDEVTSVKNDDTEVGAAELPTALVPYRVPSTDLSDLEKSLDFWHEQHSRQIGNQDEEPRSKVRYNDTGSLEEVNLEDQVEYYLPGADEASNYSYGENMQYQYRQLWNLRATLAKNEGLSSQTLLSRDDSVTSSVTAVCRSQSSVEISQAGVQMGAAAGSSSMDTTLGYNREQMTHETRRQMYINTNNSRVKYTEVHTTYQYEIQSLEGSHESFDTLDTEGYSTDTSFMDQARSFDNASEQSGGNVEGQAHRLQQLRADSGYRSLENPPASNLVTRQLSGDIAARPMPPLIPIPKPESGVSIVEIEADTPMYYDAPQQSVSCSSSDFEGSTKLRDILEGANEPVATGYIVTMPEGYQESVTEPDEGVAGLQSPPATVTAIDSPSTWDRYHNKNNRSASRKRREFGVGGNRHALAHVTDSEYPSARLYKNSGATYSRDYSVDEKSDKIFREFSRCDPVKTRPSSSHRQHSTQSYPYPKPDKTKTISEPQDSDEQLPQDLSLPARVADVANLQTEIPVITLDDDEEEED